MGRRGYSTTIGKIGKVHHNRRVSEIRVLGELLRMEKSRAMSPDPREAQGTTSVSVSMEARHH